MTLHLLIIPSWYPSQYNPANGGFFRDQCHALRRVGLNVGVIYPELRSLRSFSWNALGSNHFQTLLVDDQGVPTLRFQGWNVPGRLQLPVWRRMALRLFDEYVDRFGRPDLIHAHGAQTAGSAASFLKQARNVRYVLTEHSSGFVRGLFPEWRRPYLESAFRDADRVMAVSRSLADAIRPWILDRGDVVEVVPNMVDTDFFDLPAEPRTEGCFGILCVALLNANKQVDVLIRSFAKAFPDDPGVALEIGGDGPERKRLESLSRDLGVGARVRFLGLLDRIQVRSAMQRNHLFVLPSAKETFGLVCVEALACGMPVIATMSGGPEEIVSNEVGWLVEPGNVDVLAETMRVARSRGGPDASRSRRLRLHAHDRFGSTTIARRLVSIYDETVGLAANQGSDRPSPANRP